MVNKSTNQCFSSPVSQCQLATVRHSLILTLNGILKKEKKLRKKKRPHWGLNSGPLHYEWSALPLSYTADVGQPLHLCHNLEMSRFCVYLSKSTNSKLIKLGFDFGWTREMSRLYKITMTLFQMVAVGISLILRIYLLLLCPNIPIHHSLESREPILIFFCDCRQRVRTGDDDQIAF